MKTVLNSGASVLSANTANLHRLYVLRNIAILGQISAVSIATLYIGLPFPLVPLYAVMGALALFNAVTCFWLKSGETGHYAPVVSATAGGCYFPDRASVFRGWCHQSVRSVLPFATHNRGDRIARYSWGLVVITIVCYSFFMAYFVALPQEHSHRGGGEFTIHVSGMWLGFVLSAGLIALGTLAASTAHELGTPLGTMTLLVEEIDEMLPGSVSAVRQPLLSLREQIDRWKGALSDLSASAGGVQLTGGSVKAVDEYLDEVRDEWQRMRPDWGSRPSGGVSGRRREYLLIVPCKENCRKKPVMQ